MKRMFPHILLLTALVFLLAGSVQRAFAALPSTPALEPIDILITETINLSDVVAVTPPAVITVTEAVALTDSTTVVGPVVVVVPEAVAVVDSVSTGEVTSSLEVPVEVTETITVMDAPVLVGPVVIAVTESVTVGDSVAAPAPGPAPLLRLSQSAFFGNVAEILPSSFIITTGIGDVRLLSTTETVVSGTRESGVLGLVTGQRVAVVANGLPAIGPGLPDGDLVTALTVTVIPQEVLRHHRQCAVVEEVGDGGVTLACNDGTTAKINESQLGPGDSVVVLFQPQRPAQLVGTAMKIVERLAKMADQASDQRDLELASRLTGIQDETAERFAAKFSEIRDAAPPELGSLMKNLRSSMAELVMAAAAGDGVVVAGAGTVTQMIARLEQMIGSMDQCLIVGWLVQNEVEDWHFANFVRRY